VGGEERRERGMSASERVGCGEGIGANGGYWTERGTRKGKRRGGEREDDGLKKRKMMMVGNMKGLGRWFK